MSIESRDEFEAFISLPPHEKEISRFPDDGSSAWPGSYKNLIVDLAWDAWQASRQNLEVKPFTWVFTDVNGKANEIAGDPVHRSPQDLRIYTALYTHPVRADDLIEPVAGEMVSIDVSTCDEDNGNRVFGEIVGWQDDGDGKRIWLCSLDHFNYTHPASESKGRIEGDKSGYGRIADSKAVSVPKQWVDLMRELVKDLISEIKTKQKLKPDERVAEDLGAVREAIAIIAKQEQGHE